MSGILPLRHGRFVAGCALAGIFAAAHLAVPFLDLQGGWARWLPFIGGAVAVVGLCWILDTLSAAKDKLVAALAELPARERLETLLGDRSAVGDPARVAMKSLDRFRNSVRDEPEICLGICAFRDSRVPMMHVSNEGIVLGLNSSGHALMRASRKEFAAVFAGFDPDKVVGLSIAKFSLRLTKGLKTLDVQDAKPVDIEIDIGKTVFSVNLSTVHSSDGSAVGNLLKWTDVTEMHRASAIVRALGRAQVMLELDANGILVDANEALAALARREQAELIGKHFRDFLHSDPASSGELDEIWTGLRTGKALTGLLFLHIEDGSDAFLRATFTPIQDTGGALGSVVVTAVDVTAILSDRRSSAKERDALIAAQQNAVEVLAIALQDFASGNLSLRISEPFTEGLGHIPINGIPLRDSL